MFRTAAGYTIIEVMIFLAISGLLLVSASVVVGGQAAHTEFTTAMNDLNSKMQQWINQVSNGASGNTSSAAAAIGNYECSLDSSQRPVLSQPSSGTGRARGSNPDCIFLGKAIQVNTSSDFSDKIYAYSVLGRRIYTTTSGDETIVDSLMVANPVVAYFPDSSIDLTETYFIPNGARIISAKSLTTGNDRRLMGIFNSLNRGSAGSDTENGSQAILASQYPLDSDVAPRDQRILDCVKMLDPCPASAASSSGIWPMQNWTLCLGSTRNNDKATLTFSSNNSQGLFTKLEFKQCS